MNEEPVTLKLPATLYAKLEELAIEEQTIPENLIATLVDSAFPQRSWLRHLAKLREQIKRDGGHLAEESQEEFIERLSHARREIFDAEYAHLY